MRQRRHFDRWRTAWQRHWRVRPHAYAPDELVPQLTVRPLEDRRVLSVSPAVALALAAVNGETDLAEGVVQNPDPATPLGTDAAHQQPVDPGDRVVVGNSDSPVTDANDTDGPAAENLDESDNSSVTSAEDIEAAGVQANVAADITAAPQAAPADEPLEVDEGTPLPIENIGEFTDPAGGSVYHYSIDWGDGTTPDTGLATIDQQGDGELPTLGSFDGLHTYADNGVYTVKVTITPQEREPVVINTFDVVVTNVAPTLEVPGTQSGFEGTAVTIQDIGKITDPGFDNPLNTGGEKTETFIGAVDWGDGTAPTIALLTIDQLGNADSPTRASFDASHVYADNGTYKVTVTVNDDDGGSATSFFFINIANVAPTLEVPTTKSGFEGTLLTIQDIGKITDPGFDNPLNTGGEKTETFIGAVDWGDGTAPTILPLTIDAAGNMGSPTKASFDANHVYADNGTYKVTVTVIDDDGGSVSSFFFVNIANVAPTLEVPGPKSGFEGTLLTIQDIGKITDPGFDNPLNTGGEKTETFIGAVDWGDGTAPTILPLTIDAAGGIGIPTKASFDASHVYADNGTYKVTVSVSDDDGGTVTNFFFVTIANVDPTLEVSGDRTIAEGSLLTVPDIGKITDPGFDNPLNTGGEKTETFIGAVDWGDGSALTILPLTIDTAGGIGTPTKASFDASHTYADNGVYKVTVTVNDDDGGTATSFFFVTVTNVAPTLDVPADQLIAEGAPLNLPNIGVITDPGFANPDHPDGPTSETFTYTINWGDGTPTQNGSATIDPPPGGVGVPTRASFDGNHTYADNGTYKVTVTVTDDDGGTTSNFFFVNVFNVDPTLEVSGDRTIAEGSLLTVPDIGKITDPGFDNPLNTGGEKTETFIGAVDWGDGSAPTILPLTIDTAGGVGTPTKASFDASHTYADNGVYKVTVTVNDDDGGTATSFFFVTVTNVAPTLDVPADQLIAEGAPLNLPNIGVITDPGFANPNHPDGPTSETFTYTISWGDGTPTQNGSATIDPPPGGIGVPTRASFDGNHTYADNGTYKVTVTVTDDDGGTTSNFFFVNVTNVAPTLDVPGTQNIAEGSPLNLSDIGVITDPGFANPDHPDGPTSETFTYTINWGDGTPTQNGSATIDPPPGGVGVPTRASFAGNHTYADNGTYKVTVTVTDDDGGTTSNFFFVDVFNVAPTLDVPADQLIAEGSPLNLPNIGVITDPGFANPDHPDGPTSETFTYTINWGDGTPTQNGSATIDPPPGGIGVPTRASFDGNHTYADNGTYKVTVTVTDDDGGTTSNFFFVDVFNVDPTLAGPGDQFAEINQPLVIGDIGTFSDPGFDNPLNVGGETSETFLAAIDWGDGSDPEIVPVTIDTPGHAGQATLGSFDGTHTYTHGGTYTVTLVLTDDDGGVATTSFRVFIEEQGILVVGAQPQSVNEGALLSVVNIGQFADPRAGGADSYTYTINWGDGTTPSQGPATIDSGEGSVQGSFDGAHIYADNGTYQVTVSVLSSDGRQGQAVVEVVVNNVAPTLVVPGDQLINLGSVASLANIGQFVDPGFNNPLNPGLEKAETFTFTVNWGDAQPLNQGAATVDVPGAAGLATGGSFDSDHLFLSPGTYLVTVTVLDDDGGTASGQFTVTVVLINPGVNAMFVPPGGSGGGPASPQPALPSPPSTPQAPNSITRGDAYRVGGGAVAGAEMRLVLRIVSPDGVEDRNHDETLPDDVRDNLRALFRRLTDGHYRIYEIQPDGIERLVVDVFVVQGRNINVIDQFPEGDAGPRDQIDAPPAVPAAQGDESLPPPAEGDSEPAPQAAMPASDSAATTLPAVPALAAPTPETVDSDSQASNAEPALYSTAAVLGAGSLWRSLPKRRRLPREAQTTERRFDKVRRLMRGISDTTDA